MVILKYWVRVLLIIFLFEGPKDRKNVVGFSLNIHIIHSQTRLSRGWVTWLPPPLALLCCKHLETSPKMCLGCGVSWNPSENSKGLNAHQPWMLAALCRYLQPYNSSGPLRDPGGARASHSPVPRYSKYLTKKPLSLSLSLSDSLLRPDYCSDLLPFPYLSIHPFCHLKHYHTTRLPQQQTQHTPKSHRDERWNLMRLYKVKQKE